MPTVHEELEFQGLDQPAIPFHTAKPKDEERIPTAKEDPSLYFYVNTSLVEQPNGRDIRKKDLCGHSVLKYQGGTPEQYCKWRRTMQALFSKRECADIGAHHAQQLKLYRGALDGTALDTFDEAYEQYTEQNGNRQPRDPNDPQLGETVILLQALNEVALRAFGDRDDMAETQRHYLTNRIPIHPMTVRQWSDRLRELSNYLKYFPITTEDIHNVAPATFPQPLTDQDLRNTLRQSAPPAWIARLRGAGDSLAFTSFSQMVARFGNLQIADNIEKAIEERKAHNSGATQSHNGKSHQNRGRKQRPSRNHRDMSPAKMGGDVKYGRCEHCQRHHPNPGDGCWTLAKNKHLRPDRSKRSTASNKRQKQEGKRDKRSASPAQPEQANVTLSRADYKRLKARAAQYDSSDDDNQPASSYSLTESGDDYYEQLRAACSK